MNKKFKCFICDKELSSNQKLKQHVFNKHDPSIQINLKDLTNDEPNKVKQEIDKDYENCYFFSISDSEILENNIL